MSDLWQTLVFMGAIFLMARWFCGVGVGAPYVPCKRQHVEDALALVRLTPQDVVLDLGSGDGRVLVAAAKQGARVIGYEINPFLCWLSRFHLRFYKDRVRIVSGNFFQADLQNVTVIFIFGITTLMPKVAAWMKQAAKPGTVILSLAFELPGFVCVEQHGAVKKYIVGESTTI